MSSLKTKRIASDISRAISIILHEEAKNEVLKKVSITDVTVDDDLTFAKVYFMTRLDDTKFVENELNESAGFIRKELAKSLDLRSTPELKFVYDSSLDYANKIEDIIDKLNEGEEKNG